MSLINSLCSVSLGQQINKQLRFKAVVAVVRLCEWIHARSSPSRQNLADRQLHAACSPPALQPRLFLLPTLHYSGSVVSTWAELVAGVNWRRVCSGTARRGGVCGSYGMVDEQRKR